MIEECNSNDDEIESWRAHQITLEECNSHDDEIESWRARKIAMDECTKSIPQLV